MGAMQSDWASRRQAITNWVTIQSPRIPIHAGDYNLRVNGAIVDGDFVRPEHLNVYLSVDSAIEAEDAPRNLPSA